MLGSAPLQLATARLRLRRPTSRDAQGIFAYASDPQATRYMAWPRHESLEDTRAFLSFVDDEWRQRGCGTYVIVDETDEVLGSTGLHLVAPHRASTGYILTPRLWGQGLATEALCAMVELARALALVRLEADCFTEHRASARVLEKAGFLLEGTRRAYLTAPNQPGAPILDALGFARILR